MRNVGWITAILLLVWGCFVPVVRARTPLASDPAALARPAIRVYTSDSDGLPQNSIQALCVDRRGYLWIGTDDGAAFYNGHRWTTVLLPNRAVTNTVSRNSIFCAADGTLWFGTRGGGLLRWRDGVWDPVENAEGMAGKSVFGIAETFENGKSVIWCGVFGGGIFRLADGKWTVFNASNTPGIVSNEVTTLLSTQAADGKWLVWMGTTKGVSRFSDGAWQRMDDKPKFLLTGEGETSFDNSVFCLAELHAPDGRKAVFTGAPNGGVARWVDGTWSAFSTDTKMPDPRVFALTETVAANGKYVLWAGTQSGLWRFADGVWTNATEHTPFRTANILSFALMNPPGGRTTLWAGSHIGGLLRLQDGNWVKFDEKSGLPSADIQCFAEEPSETGASVFWMGGMRGGIASFSDGKWSLSKFLGKGYDGTTVNQFLRTSAFDGKPSLLLVSTSELMRVERDRIVTADIDPRLKIGFLNCAAEITEADGKKKVWAGTIKGMHRFDGTKWTEVQEDLSPRGAVRALLEVADGTGDTSVWVGSERAGVFVRRDGKWRVLTVKDGLPGNKVNTLIEGVGPSGQPVIWVGTNSGLAVLDAAAPDKPLWILTDATVPALPNNVVYGFCRDRRGRIYATTNKGVARLSFQKNVPPDASPMRVETFTTEDGLPSNECVSRPFVDGRGRVWVGSGAGAAMLDPEGETTDAQPKALLIERVALGEKGTVIGPEARLGSDDNDPVFSFALLSFFREGETRYRTELVGYDKHPSEWTADTRRAFLNLPERDFTFRVWARDYAGNVSGPVEFRFRVVPPFWRRWWAYLLYMGLAGAAITLGVRTRIRVLASRNRLLEERVAARTTELADAVEKLQIVNAESERKNRDLEVAKLKIEEKNHELDRKVEELVASQRQADRIFSALAEALPGTTLDEKYRLDEKIGAGGFGAVFRATHLGLNRPIAVKIFRPASGNDSIDAIERFRREGIATCRVNHPNAVTVLDSGISSDGIAYIVMELLEGESLADILRRTPSLSLHRCAEIVVPVCEALEAAHAAGIIHRDIKPDNIFIHRTADGEVVKVVDFGIAKLVGADDNENMETLTRTGGIVGTPVYMAPERLSGNQYDGKSDLYSVGVMLYQMLCGRVPFPSTGSSFVQVALLHLRADPPPLRSYNATIPEKIEAVVMRTLSKAPADRPAPHEFVIGFMNAVTDLPEDMRNTLFVTLPAGWDSTDSPTSRGELPTASTPTLVADADPNAITRTE
jgi:serine/threonine protein kinase/ligand-binding sensor domain-containing protein